MLLFLSRSRSRSRSAAEDDAELKGPGPGVKLRSIPGVAPEREDAGDGVVGRDDEKSDVVRAWECLKSGVGDVGTLV